MRKIPDVTPPEDITPRKLEIVEQRRTYELITPLYGGGVQASKADPVTLVRATEIRGLLRFWWRVMRGGTSEGDLSMQEREDAIWGKAYKKGDVGLSSDQVIQIVVDVVQEGKAIKPFEMKRQQPAAINGIPSYAAFPLQPDKEERKKAKPFIADLRQGVKFTLTIIYPVYLKEEIEAALWTWETFGGLGARTRRGFGALHLIAINDEPYRLLPTSQNAKSWIQRKASEHNRGGNFLPGVPHLGSTPQIVVTSSSANSMAAWRDLIKQLKDFRQEKDVKRRSAWPEADTIRATAGTGTAPNIQKFPRAAFGLPIIFHFTGNTAPREDYTLNEADTSDSKPSNKERFASPLILRPFLCSDNRAVGLVLLLEGSRVDLRNLILQDNSKAKNVQTIKGTHILNGTLSSGEARAIASKSSASQNALSALQNETDILQAFLKSVKGV